MRKEKKKGHHPLSAEAKGLFAFGLAFILLLSLFTFFWGAPAKNWLGFAGYGIALSLSYLFGLASYLFPLLAIGYGVRIINGKSISLYDPLYAVSLIASTALLLTIFGDAFPDRSLPFAERILTEKVALLTPYPIHKMRYNLGGVPFYYLYRDLPLLALQTLLSTIGSTLLFSSVALISLILLTRLRLVELFQTIYNGLKAQKKPPVKAPLKAFKPLQTLPPILTPQPKKESAPLIIKQLPPPKPALKSANSENVPSTNLLSQPKQRIDQPTLKRDLKKQATILEETLRSFGIEAKVGDIQCGPTITSFEVHPAIGVKVQKIKALENDIALNMEAKSIRIVAPIPGKAAVGVEIPAIHPQEVSFKEMMDAYAGRGKKMSIPILLGKSVSGEAVISDLAKMPHLLIAGATGSGKSVCINTIVMSILMNASPDEVRLLMVDPKKVELTQYSTLPHMIAPVITEPHGAYAALQWLVREMHSRYEIFKQLAIRNIAAFNSRKIDPKLEAALAIPIPAKLPYMVAIIDEFADLMMTSSTDLETPIARIAQMARAVGIHLILATQRPSREVITGIIKANIPSRISFKVASRINSQIILDEVGAETLLGNGDCLFLPPGSSQLIRAQGAYISDDDIRAVVEHLEKSFPTNYLIPSFDAMRLTPEEGDGEGQGKDALYDQALQIVLAARTASTTFLQRKLKIGYARAASLVDELEANGVIGPQDGSRGRRVLGGHAPDLSLEDDER